MKRQRPKAVSIGDIVRYLREQYDLVPVPAHQRLALDNENWRKYIYIMLGLIIASQVVIIMGVLLNGL